MGITAPRVVSDVALGISWQASEGLALPGSYTPDQFIFARNVTVSEEPNLLDPQGTHGRFFKHAGGRRISSRSPNLEIELYATKANMPFLLEGVANGQPQSTLANVDLIETNDGGAQLAAWVLNGVRPRHNLEFTAPQTHKLYVELTDVAGTRKVELFKDAAKTLKVASGTRLGDGSLTFTEFASSGLSGTVTVTYTGDDLDIVLEITRIKYQFAGAISRYFRIVYRDGGRNLILSDCSLASLELRASENAELMVTARILARRFDIQDPGVVYTVAGLDLETYSMSELTFTKDPAGTPISPAVDDFKLTIANNIEQYVANSALPQKLIKRGWQTFEGTIRGEFGDELESLIDQARGLITSSGTAAMTVLRSDFDFNGKLRIDLPVGHFMIMHPKTTGELVDKVELSFEGLTDGSVDAAAITLEV